MPPTPRPADAHDGDARQAIGRVIRTYVAFALIFVLLTELAFEVSDGAAGTLAIRVAVIALSSAILVPLLWRELRSRQEAETKLDQHTAATETARERRLEMLHRVGQHLASVLGDPTEARLHTSRALAPEFVDLADVVLAETDPELAARYRGQAPRLLHEGFTAEPALASIMPVNATIRSAAVVPVTAGGTLVAVLVAANSLGRPHLSDSDLEALEQVAVRVGATLERIRLHREVSRSERLESLGRLAGGVAHDFNNLLTVILGYSDMVLRRLPEDSQDRADLEAVRRAAEQARDLTDQLLTVSKRRVVQPEPLDPNEVVESIGQVLRRLVGSDIDLLAVTSEVDRVLIDRAQLEQVLLNLVVNARDAMPDGGRLTLSTERSAMPGGRAATMLRVSDTGHGMDEDTRAHCFEPFFTTKGGQEGTGLGLATVYGVVTQAGGEITIDTTPGQGTTFSVLLPAVDEHAEHHADVRTGGDVRARILLVDDEAEVRRFTRRNLEVEGYTVIEAGSGEEALTVLAGEAPVDLLVTDVVMPGMTGPELARQAGSLRRSLPVLFVSGFASDPAFHGNDRSTVHFLPKPFDAHQLGRAVQDALAGASQGSKR